MTRTSHIDNDYVSNFRKAIEINTKIIIFKNYESLTFITHFNPTATAIAFHFFESQRNSTFEIPSTAECQRTILLHFNI